MTTQMIESYGIDIGYIITAIAALFLILFITVIVLLVKVSKFNKRLGHFTEGKDAMNLEELMLSKFSDIDSIVNNEKKQNKDIKYIAERSTIAFNKSGLIKYNAFREMTGNLSFALALLNDNNTGVIINSMHSREGCFTYAKEIINGKSYIVLSEEEKEALEAALTLKPNPVEELLEKDRAEKTTEEINQNMTVVAKNNVKEPPAPMAKIRKPEDLNREKTKFISEEPKPTVADEARVKKLTSEEREKFVTTDEAVTTSLSEEIPTRPRNSDLYLEANISTKLADEIKTKPREEVLKEDNPKSTITRPTITEPTTSFDYEDKPEKAKIEIKVNTSIEDSEDFDNEDTFKSSSITITQPTKNNTMRILPTNTYDKNAYESLMRQKENNISEIISEPTTRATQKSNEVIADANVDLGFQDDIGKKPAITIKTNYDIDPNYKDEFGGIL